MGAFLINEPQKSAYRRCLLRAAWAVSWVLAMAVSAPADLLATFKTPIGDMDVVLFDQDKPETVRNFVRYVQSGRYDGSFIERWAPGFVVQGGGQVVQNRDTAPSVTPVTSFGQITNEYDVGAEYSNVYGTIAMARRAGVTNSATSSWFINLADNSGLDSVDGGFTVFGRVVGGLNVLNTFVSFQSALDADIHWAYPNPLHADYLPLNTTNTAATLDDLIYVDIRVVEMKPVSTSPEGAPVISWQSAAGRTNHVEYATSLTVQDWHPLLTTNGTGGIMQVVDPSNALGARLYRVVIDP